MIWVFFISNKNTNHNTDLKIHVLIICQNFPFHKTVFTDKKLSPAIRSYSSRLPKAVAAVG